MCTYTMKRTQIPAVLSLLSYDSQTGTEYFIISQEKFKQVAAFSSVSGRLDVKSYVLLPPPLPFQKSCMAVDFLPSVVAENRGPSCN